MVTTFEEDNIEEDDSKDEQYEDNDEDCQQITQIAKELAADWTINDWVAVVYFGKWYPGVVQNVRNELKYNCQISF